MADFCTKCSEELFGKEVTPDIDIEKILEELEPNSYMDGLLCEGCGLSAIGRTKEGEGYVAVIDGEEHNGEITFVKWMTIDEHQQLNINH